MKNTKYTLWQNIGYMYSMMLRAEKRAPVFILLNSLSAVALSLLSSLLIKLLIDVIQGGISQGAVFAAVGGFVLASSFFASVKLLTDKNFVYKTQSVIRAEAFGRTIDKVMRVPYETIESREKRTLLKKAESFFANGDSCSISGRFTNFTTDFFGIFSCVALFAIVDYRLILVLLAAAAFTFAVEKSVQLAEKNMRDDVITVNEKLDYFTTGKPTDIKAAKDIRVFNIADWFAPIIDVITGNLKQIYYSCAGRVSRLRGVEALVFILRDCAVIAFLIDGVRRGAVTVGNFAFLFGIITAFAQWTVSVSEDFCQIKFIAEICDDYRIFLDLDEQDRNELPAADIDMNAPCEIEFSDVEFSYDGQRKILNGISLKVKPGEKIAIVGENGAGKTTLVKLLCGLYNPDGGKITVNGVNALSLPRAQQYSLFSAVFQDAFILPAGIEKNITLSSEPADPQRLARVIEQSGLGERISSLKNGADTLIGKKLNKGGIDLSGGEKQKLFLARALYKDAPVIVLDEPTAALDPIAENELYVRFSELTHGKTSFYISHRLSSTRFCDRIIYLKNGAVIENGSHDELMKKRGEYYRMYRMQSYYYREEGNRYVV